MWLVRNLKVPSFKITRSWAREGGLAIQYCHRSGFPAAVRREVPRYAEGVEKERGAGVCLGQIGSGRLGPGLSVKGEASRGCERSFVMRPVCFDRPGGGGKGGETRFSCRRALHCLHRVQHLVYILLKCVFKSGE